MMPTLMPMLTFRCRARTRRPLLLAALAFYCVGLAAAGEEPQPPVPPPAPVAPEAPAPIPAVPAAPEAPAPAPPPKKAFTIPNVEISATRQSFVEEKDALVLSGSAWVRYQGIKIEADNIIFFRTTHEVYAEGNVRVRAGDSEISAEIAYMDADSSSGYMLDATMHILAKPDSLKGFGGPKESEKGKNKGKVEEPKVAAKPKTVQPMKTEAEQEPSLFRTRDPYGVYLDVIHDPQARTNLILKAEKLIQHNKLHYSAENVFVTNDDMVHPMYGVRAGEMDFFLHEVPDPQKPESTLLKPEKLVAKRWRLKVLGFSSFPMPTITYDFARRNPYFSIDEGSSSRWGTYALIRFGYTLGGRNENKVFQPTHIYFDVDERMKRGPGGGIEMDWRTGGQAPPAEADKSQVEHGSGHLRVYGEDEIQIDEADDLERARRNLDRRIEPKVDGFPQRVFDANLLFVQRRKLDNAQPPSLELDLHQNDFRGLVDFQNHQPIKRVLGIENLQLDMVYKQESDRDFMLEYFKHNYNTENQPEALASLRKPGENYSLEILYRGNPQNFDGATPRSPFDFGTFTTYQPAVTYSLAPMPLNYGFYLTAELQAANLKRDFEREIYDQPGFESGRAYGIIDLARPLKWGPVNFVPHIGTQQQVYDNSRDGSNIAQGAVTYGLDITSRIYGTFADLNNEELGLKGLRHIIEPRISYRGISDTREDPARLFDFDQIDDLTRQDKVTFALDQTFQTRREDKDGGLHTVSVAGVDVAMDYFPRGKDQDRLLDGGAFDLLRVDGFLRVLDVARLDGGIGFSTETGNTETAVVGITIDPQTRWRLAFDERFNFSDHDRRIVGSDQYRLKFEYQLSERWQFAYEQIFEKRKANSQINGRQVERISLTRSYGPLNATVGFSEDRNTNDHTFFTSVHPALAYRNVIVPSQDLLVNPAEVSGEDEAPEERNFDPFQLLKDRKKKSAAPAKKATPAPPAGTAPSTPAPAPPPPAPAPGTDAPPAPAAPAPEKGANAPPHDADAEVAAASPAAAAKKRATAASGNKVDEDDWTAPVNKK